MHEITVKKLFMIIAETQLYCFEHLDNVGSQYTSMLENCDVLNIDNRSLQRKRELHCINKIVGEREFDFTGDEIISGDFLLYTYGTHDNCERILEYKNLKEIENHILGDAGMSNMFTGEIIVIVKGELLPYEIWGLDKNDVERKFEQKQISDSNDYKKSRIKWLK